MPEIAQGRAISTLTTRNCVKRLQHIRNSANAEGWQRRAWARLEAEQQQHEEEQRRRAEEMERLSQLVAGYRRYAEKLQQTRVEIEDTLRTQSGKVADIPSGRKWLVLGYRRSRATTARRVVLRCCEATTDDDSCQATALGVWATQGLERILDGCAYVFESDTDKYGRTTFWLPPVGPGKLSGLEIEIDPARVFQLEGRPQGLLEPDPGRCRPRPPAPGHLQALAEKEQEHQAQLEAEQRAQEQSRLLEAPANPKDTKKALDLPSSEYLCRRYASTTFRGAPRTLPLLVSAGEDGEPATDLETPTYGYFLKGEVVVRRYRGAAKGTRPPCSATWAQSGRHRRRRRTAWPPMPQFAKRTPSRPPRSRRGCKTTLPCDTPRRRAPQAPNPTIFWPFLCDTLQYGRAARALGPRATPRNASRAHCRMHFAAPGTARTRSAVCSLFCELFPCLLVALQWQIL